jgi:ferritin-like metal-binding protein YciE
MKDHELRERVTEFVRDARDMEQALLAVLDGVIPAVKDREVLTRLRLHRDETRQHAQLLGQRLKALGKAPQHYHREPIRPRDWLDGWNDVLMIYGLLENLAQAVGDQETTSVSQQILKEKTAMATWVADRCDHLHKFVV